MAFSHRKGFSSIHFIFNLTHLLSAFKTTDQAPDLHVILEPSDTPPKSYTNPGQFINLGKLHKVSGVQSYPIPDVVDVASYKSVVIWCRMANATIGYAQLKSEASASQ
jgi:hypothetical protein